jgi:hypothetical protein
LIARERRPAVTLGSHPLPAVTCDGGKYPLDTQHEHRLDLPTCSVATAHAVSPLMPPGVLVPCARRLSQRIGRGFYFRAARMESPHPAADSTFLPGSSPNTPQPLPALPWSRASALHRAERRCCAQARRARSTPNCFSRARAPAVQRYRAITGVRPHQAFTAAAPHKRRRQHLPPS